MFTSVRFKKFRLLVARRYETPVLEGIASLGAAQLTDAKAAVGGEGESGEVYDRFLRLGQRCSAALGAVASIREKHPGLVPETPPEGTMESGGKGIRIPKSELEGSIDYYERRLDSLTDRTDSLLGEVEGLGLARRRLALLNDMGLGGQVLGPHEFVTVKVGLVPSQALSALGDELSSSGAVMESAKGEGETLVAVVGPKGKAEAIGEQLRKGGFQEVEVPPGLERDPGSAAAQVESRLGRAGEEAAKVEGALRALRGELEARMEYVVFLREAGAALARTRDLCALEGWIVEGSVGGLREKVAGITSGSYYLQVEDPKAGEPIPVLFPKRGRLMRGFELLTSVRGVPSYNELDPTFLFAIFFPLMYGIMFGDVGDGAVILVLGALLYRAKRSFIGLSAHALNSLGTIMMLGGASAIAFGVLYGSVFLSHAFFPPLLFDPVTSYGVIIEVSLVFGVAQLAISLGLNVWNHLRRSEVADAILSGKGVLGLGYYILGVILAVKLISGGLQISLFVAPENIPLTAGAVGCLLLTLVAPALRHLRGGGSGLGKDLAEGFGEFIEVFISFMTNSLSYLRLAAFAIAHGIFAGFAADLGSSIGTVASLVSVNALVVVVDGFAAGIQSVRLLYYEFSTRFFAGAGTRFKPLRLGAKEES